jgi:hypothetical protein
VPERKPGSFVEYKAEANFNRSNIRVFRGLKFAVFGRALSTQTVNLRRNLKNTINKVLDPSIGSHFRTVIVMAVTETKNSYKGVV